MARVARRSRGFVTGRSLISMGLALAFLVGCYFLTRWLWPEGGVWAGVGGVVAGYLLLMGIVFGLIAWLDRGKGSREDA